MERIIIRKSLADTVADELQQQIRKGVYPVDSRLPIEPELMQIFGVGRSTIREAIRILSNNGLLRVQQGLGTFVVRSQVAESLDTQFSRSGIADILEVRQLLEQKIAEKAAINRTEDQLKKMKQLLKKRKVLAEKEETEECIRTDISFHISIAEACGNPILTDLYKSASSHVSRWFMKSHKNAASFRKTQGMHEDLYGAIEQGDAKKAAMITAKIIEHI
ncbi:FadR/GntR family transcriptional regulator [Pollutibacter soli]|uniref:FadR/GntR family transcriptional regulator n=1 Tax=Pollutibacter soli TaxID=3034157 RepID=UPI0030133DC2